MEDPVSIALGRMIFIGWYQYLLRLKNIKNYTMKKWNGIMENSMGYDLDM